MCKDPTAFGVVPRAKGPIRGEHGQVGQIHATRQATTAVDEGHVHLLTQAHIW